MAGRVSGWPWPGPTRVAGLDGPAMDGPDCPDDPNGPDRPGGPGKSWGGNRSLQRSLGEFWCLFVRILSNAWIIYRFVLKLFLKSVWKKFGSENGELERAKVCQSIELSSL